VAFGRLLAEAVTRYAAKLDRLAAQNRAATPDSDEPAGRAA